MFQRGKTLGGRRRQPGIAVMAAVLAAGVLAGCASYEEKDFTADDECRDCGDKGGIFSGDDGEFTIF